jgi:hypothetical protein
MSEEEAAKQKFNWSHLWIKLTSRQLLLTVAWVFMAFWCVIHDKDADFTKIVVIIAGCATGLYILGDKVIDAITQAIKNINLTEIAGKVIK